MLIKKIIGLSILFLNIAGVGFLIFMIGMLIKDRFSSTKKDLAGVKASGNKRNPRIINDDILSDDDDLLKDMDLSDLENINLDDYE